MNEPCKYRANRWRTAAKKDRKYTCRKCGALRVVVLKQPEPVKPMVFMCPDSETFKLPGSES